MPAPTKSWDITDRSKNQASVRNDTMRATLLNAEAVPYLTTVSDKLKLSWLAHEKNPTINDAARAADERG